MYKRNMLIVFVCTLILILSSCAANETPAQQPSSDSVETDNDFERIMDMKTHIEDNHINVKSFILIQNDKTIAENYFNGTKPDTPAPIYSCTKSVISALVGIAIDEGEIKSVDEKVGDLLDLEQMGIIDESKYDITLKDLLTMSSGLDPLVSNEFVAKQEAVKYILEQPAVYAPGEVFEYTSGGPHVISAIIQQATGMETSEYAQEKLFNPMGIAKPKWQKDAAGLAMGGFGLELTPMQLAAVGSLFLNEARWNGEQVISKKWIHESTSHKVDTAMSHECEQFGYGYLWWQNGFGGFSAHGYAGQYIFVLPEYNAVAVFTSELREQDFPIPYQLMGTYVLPCLK